MKKLILAVCLVFMVGVGFAMDYLPKTFTTETYIATLYDDGKIKYALTEDDITLLFSYDIGCYLAGMLDYKFYQSLGLQKIGNIECKFFIRRTRDDEVYLTVQYSFVLMSYKYEGGIPLKERNRIIDKVSGLTRRTWKHIKDPIIDEIKNGF